MKVLQDPSVFQTSVSINLVVLSHFSHSDSVFELKAWVKLTLAGFIQIR